MSKITRTTNEFDGIEGEDQGLGFLGVDEVISNGFTGV